MIIAVIFIVIYVSPFAKTRTEAALIFFGRSDSDVNNTISLAKSIGADEIYMYVAYEGIADVNKPQFSKTFGMHYQGSEFAKNTVQLFHSHGLKVTAVISSQLFGPRPPSSARAVLQQFPDNRISDLIDPVKSENMVNLLAVETARCGFDGIFIGEPYYDNYQIRFHDTLRSQRWNNFYAVINNKLHREFPKLKTKLILPVHFFQYQGFKFGAGLPDHGLSIDITKQGFDEVGLDLSSAVLDGSTDQLPNFEVMTALAKCLGGKNTIVELTANRFGSNSMIPIEVLISEINILHKYNINKIIFFSNKSLSNYSLAELKRLKSTLQAKSYNVSKIKEITLFIRQGVDWQKDIKMQVERAKTFVNPKYVLHIRLVQ